MNSNRKSILKYSLLACTMSCSLSFAASDQQTNTLFEKAYYWYEQGRSEISEDAWKKILRLNPNNIEAQNGLDELSSTRNYKVNQNKLSQARELAAKNQYSDAIAAYNDAFGGAPKTSYHAIEYYQTLAGIESRWPEAVAGMKRLSEQYPSYTRVSLALAEMLSYREATRRDAIQQMTRLAGNGDLTTAQQSSLKQAHHNALIWLQASEEDRDIFSSYLQQHPDDELVRKAAENLDTVKSSKAGDAYVLLNAGKLRDAEKAFQAILQEQPEDAEALAGLGIIELRRKNFGKASRLMGQAGKENPEVRKSLATPMRNASFWSLMQRANTAKQIHDYTQAERLARKAQQYNSRRIEPKLLLAAIQHEQGNYEASRDLYQSIVDQHPDNKEAKNGLVHAHIALGEHAAAKQSINRLRLANTPFQDSLNTLESEALRERANKMSDLKAARQLLEEALELNPEDVWLRLDLARAYEQSGYSADAIALFDNLINIQPHNNDAYYAKALFLDSRGDWSYALSTMEYIPPEQFTPEQQAFSQHLWANAQKQEALAAFEAGNVDEARRIATQLARSDENYSVQTQLPYAELLVAFGDVDEGLAIARTIVDPINKPDINTRIRYGSMLLDAGRINTLKALLERSDMQRRTGLDRQQVKRIENLRLNMALKEADILRADRQYSEALEVLKTAREKHPDAEEIKTLQAASYLDSGNANNALKRYSAMIEAGNLSDENYQGAAHAAFLLKQYSTAEDWVTEGLTHTPNSPELLALRSRLELMRGENQSAASNLAKAGTLVQSIDGSETYGGGGNLDLLSGSNVKLAPSLSQSRRQFYRLNDNNRTRVSVSNGYQSRGENGLDEIEERALPLHIEYQKDWGSTFGLDINVMDLSGENVTNTATFGGLPLDQNSPVSSTNIDADGIAVSARYQGENWSADIGTTPTTFLLDSITGGIGWKQKTYSGTMSAELSSRPVKESILSYAGAKDPQFGQVWGGVSRTGLDLQGNQDLKDKLTVYAGLGFYGLDGDNVASNNEQKFNIGGYWRAIDEDHRRVRLGLNLRYRGFDENLRFFTLGHGGYFSPQQYVSLTAPVSVSGVSGKMNYQVSGEVGVYSLDEDPAAFFPDSATLQAQWANIADTTPGLEANHEGRTDSGLLYSVKAQGNYLVNNHFTVGGWLSTSNAENYESFSAGLSVRYMFSPRVFRGANFIRSTHPVLDQRYW